MKTTKPLSQLFCLLLCCFFLLSGCSGTPKQPAVVKQDLKKIHKEQIKPLAKNSPETLQPPPKQEETQLRKKSSVEVPVISAHKKKKHAFEFVRIDGEKYPVPELWQGRKLDAKPLAQPALQKIPVSFTYNRSQLFLLGESVDAFVKMALKAEEDSVHLLVHSAYRSSWYQRKIFSKMMTEGRTWEDLVRYVAPPGYSEHMLGAVVDLYPSNWSFASTPEYKWLKKNAAEFGFTETYPESGKDGFPWEPWHWKYMNVKQKLAGE